MNKTLIALALAVTATTASAQGYISTDRFGYTGSVTRYATQADLQNQVNGTTTNYASRDLSIYFANNNSSFTSPYSPVEAIFMTAWYPTHDATPGHDGYGNPSNTTPGFIQMFDDNGSSITTQSQTWLDVNKTIFGFSSTGQNTVYGCVAGVGDCGRLSSNGGGIFHDWSISLTAYGLTPAVFNPATGVWESVSEATSVVGSMTGVFENNSPTQIAENGWYSYDYSITMDSWAYAEGLNDDSVFGAEETAPEPASIVLLATGLMGVGAVARRRKARA